MISFNNFKASLFGFFIVVIIATFFIFTPTSTFAEPATKEAELTVHLFYSKDCPHCHDEIEFLELQKLQYPEVAFKKYETSTSTENAMLFIEVARLAELSNFAVPTTFIGDQIIIGFDNASNYGVMIEDAIKDALENDARSPAEENGLLEPGIIIIVEDAPENANEAYEENTNIEEIAYEDATEIPETIKYPIIGDISLDNLSLPVLTIVMGSLDGFNPCAMWVLITLLTLLVNTKSKKRIWLVGGLFILISGIVYYFFIAAWLNVFLFVGYLTITRIIIGILAIAAGVYFLHEYFTFKEGVCEVAPDKTKQGIVERIKKIAKPAALPTTIIGVIIIAFTVNLIELLCTLGLPAIYTKILTMSDLSTAAYYGYIGMYVLFYMIDDLIIFAIAITTMSMLGFTGKYSKYMRLVGGLLMLALGTILILKPDLLTFG